VRRLVSNTGPLLHLREARSLDLLELAGEVHIPKSVDIELGQYESEWQNKRPTWVHVDDLFPPHGAEALAWRQVGLLDSGEAEAIALTRQINADWLLTDDAAARLFAQSLGLEVHGSLGVVLWGAAVGHFRRTEAEAALYRLAKSSLWISARVLEEAKDALDQLFS